MVTAGCLLERLHTVLPTNRRVSNVSERGAFLRCHWPRAHTLSHQCIYYDLGSVAFLCGYSCFILHAGGDDGGRT